jgi:hypothetical protein
MRRLSVPRASTAVAIVATIVAVLAMMFPGLGIGATTTSHGLTPTDVFATNGPGVNNEPSVCNPGDDKIGTQPVSVLPTAVHVAQDSLLVAYFTSTWSASSAAPDELLLTLRIVDGDSSPDWITNTGTGGSERTAHGVGTVMWSFPNVPAGDYTVEATAHLGGAPGTSGQSGVNLQACSLTVFVSPTA